MFTGIITDIGEIIAVTPRAEGLRRLRIACRYPKASIQEARASSHTALVRLYWILGSGALALMVLLPVVIGAISRPFAVRRSASHDSSGPSASTSFESIRCKYDAASGPVTPTKPRGLRPTRSAVPGTETSVGSVFRGRAERKVVEAGYDPARLPPGQYLTDKWLAETTLFGPAAKVRDGIAAWRAAGVHTPIVVPSSAAGNQLKAIDEVFAAFG